VTLQKTASFFLDFRVQPHQAKNLLLSGCFNAFWSFANSDHHPDKHINAIVEQLSSSSNSKTEA
jgi:hypothetical protein